MVVLPVVMLWAVPGRAQINRLLTQGNQLYEQQKYKEAAADYAKALARDPNNVPGMFNLGNSFYQQKQYDSSRKVMEATARMSKDKGGQSAANYNIGNTYMAQQKWDDAIDAYKKTLRANPQDADAKYNLAYAEAMKKKDQQNQKQDKNKQNKDQKDQKDKKDQQKKDPDKDKKDQDQKDQDQKNQQDKDQQEPQGQPSKLSQQQADQLLNALQQEEKKLQDKMKKEKGVPVKMQKDW